MTNQHASLFRLLHQQSDVFVLPNAWDAASALLQANAGAKAVGTSSAALAWALGYQDGGALPVAEMISSIRRITRVLRVPLTVDIEDGNSPSRLLAEKIRAIRSRVPSAELFINARTDVYLRSLAHGSPAVSMVISRAEEYATAGADGLFIPGLIDISETEQIGSETKLPLNLMALPGLPGIEGLRLAGLRRLSAGPALFLAGYAAVERATCAFLAGETESMFDGALDFGRVQTLFD